MKTLYFVWFHFVVKQLDINKCDFQKHFVMKLGPVYLAVCAHNNLRDKSAVGTAPCAKELNPTVRGKKKTKKTLVKVLELECYRFAV